MICQRTGREYATPSLAMLIEGNCDAPIAISTAAPTPIFAYDRAGNIVTAQDERQRDIYGNLTTNQKDSSQYWMDAGYSGPAPTYEQQLKYGDAQFAYNNAVNIAERAKAKNSMINPTVAALTAGQAEQRYVPEFIVPDELQNLFGSVTQSASNVLTWISQNIMIVIIAVVFVVFGIPLITGAAKRIGSGR